MTRECLKQLGLPYLLVKEHLPVTYYRVVFVLTSDISDIQTPGLGSYQQSKRSGVTLGLLL